jgi:hypothetical protein
VFPSFRFLLLLLSPGRAAGMGEAVAEVGMEAAAAEDSAAAAVDSAAAGMVEAEEDLVVVSIQGVVPD